MLQGEAGWVIGGFPPPSTGIVCLKSRLVIFLRVRIYHSGPHLAPIVEEQPRRPPQIVLSHAQDLDCQC